MTFTKTLLVVLSAATLSQTALAATNKVLLKNRSFKKKALPTQGFVSTAFGSSTTKGSGGADTIAITPGVRTSYLKGVVNGQLKLPVTRTDNGDEKFTSFGRPELSADYRTLHSRRQELRFGGALQLPIYNNSADGVGGELLESIKVWGLRPYMTYKRAFRKVDLFSDTSVQWNQNYSDKINGVNFKVNRALIFKTNVGIEAPYDRRLTFGAKAHLALGLGKHKIRARGNRIPGLKEKSIQRLALEAYSRARINSDLSAYVGFNLGLTGNSFHASELITEYEDSTLVTNSIRLGLTQVF